MIIKKRVLLLFFLVSSIVWRMAAQEGSGLPVSGAVRVLSLDEVRDLAEKNSIALRQEAVDLELDRISAKSLWAQVFPSIGVSGRAGYEIPLNDSAVTHDPTYTAGVSVTLGLNAGLPFTMANISLAYKNSLLNYEQARRVLVNESAKTFYSLLAQKENLDALLGSMNLAAEQLERDRIARANGYVGELDYLSAQVSSEQAKLAYNRALAEYRAALGRFLTALGIDSRENVELRGNPEIAKLSLDTEALIADRLTQRPDLVAQRNEAERLKNARTGSFLSAKGPSVNLSANWGASVAGGLDDLVSAGVSVSIPVDSWIPNSKDDQTVKRAGAEYQKVLLELRDMENNAGQEIRTYTDSIANTWNEVEIARLQADYARRAYELAEQAYRRGTMNFLDFETTRNRLSDARQQRLQSELNYKILVLDLASTLNMEERELRNYSR